MQLGVSDEKGELFLHGEGATASFNNFNGDENSYAVGVDTLSSICREYVRENQTIHFLKIDVEGWEKQVLSGMDFQRWRPYVLCIEACKPGTEELSYDSWEHLVLDSNYRFVRTSGLNRWYIAIEKKDLEILSIPELKKIYRIKQYTTERNFFRRLLVKIYWLDSMKPVRSFWRKIKKKLRN